MSIKYKASKGPITEQQAQEFGPEITRLIDSKKGDSIGCVTPEDIVNDAKNPGTAYHTYFWGKSDSELAANQRKQMARVLMGHIKIIKCVNIEHRESATRQEVRQFQHIEISKGKTGYAKTSDILKDPDLTAQLAEKAINQIKIWVAEYENITCLGKLASLITREVDSIDINDLY